MDILMLLSHPRFSFYLERFKDWPCDTHRVPAARAGDDCIDRGARERRALQVFEKVHRW